MKKSIQFITAILIFGLFMTACEKDSTDPVDPVDPDPIVTELCFDAVDLSGSLDYARSVNFINETEGWLFGKGVDESSETTLLHTDDGGLTWSVMNTDFKVQTWSSTSEPYFDFYNSTDGYMIEEREWISNIGSVCKLKYTTDKGLTWTQITNAAVGTWDVLAVNSTDAVFIGHDVYGQEDYNSLLYRVSNTTHEITQIVELPSFLEFDARVDMNLSEDGVINVTIQSNSSGPDIVMAKSADFGLTWTYTPIESRYNYELDFPTDNTGYLLCSKEGQTYNTIFKTTDGGITWTEKNPSSNDYFDFNYINFLDAQNGLGVGTNKIYKTTDGGETWTAIACFNDSDYLSTRGIAYVSADKWYAPAVRFDNDEGKGYAEFVIYEEE